jgi:hypothetical protein
MLFAFSRFLVGINLSKYKTIGSVSAKREGTRATMAIRKLREGSETPEKSSTATGGQHYALP